MTTPTDAAAIKPCPFCGAMLSLDKGHSYWSHTEHGDCIIGAMGISHDPAILARWNARALTLSPAGDVRAAAKGDDQTTIAIPRRLLPEVIQWCEDELTYSLMGSAYNRDLAVALVSLRALAQKE